MKAYPALVFVSIWFSSCGNIEVKEEVAASPALKVQQENLPLQAPSPPTDASELQGIWTDGATENASFAINRNEIQYVDQLQSFRYKVIGDSIEIAFDDYTYKAQFQIMNDTLIMKDENGEARLWRFSN